METGVSSEWGYFFSIPLLNTSSGKVDACVVFPVDEDLPVEERTWNGRIGNLVILNQYSLEAMDENENFIHSSRFVSWKNKGLEVEQELCIFSEEVCKHTIEAVRKAPINTKSSPSEYSADIVISYSVDCNVYYNGAEVIVNGISTTALYKTIVETFRDYYDAVSSVYIPPVGQLPLYIRGGRPIEICFPEISAKIRGKLITRFPISNVTLFYKKIEHPDGTGSSGGSHSSSGGGDSSSSSGSGNNNTEVGYPGSIIDIEHLDDERTSQLYNKLYNKSGTFRNLLKDFCGKNSIAHLRWEFSNTMIMSEFGHFDMNMENYTFLIRLNINLKNYPEELVYKTMLHEAIHARFIMDIIKCYKGKIDGQLTETQYRNMVKGMSREDFPTLYDFYTKYNDHLKSQHEFMADYYITPIADALQEMDHNMNWTYCKAIAWMGLTNTEAWNELPEAERSLYIEIQNSYLADL